jgi:hypothetical protein
VVHQVNDDRIAGQRVFRIATGVLSGNFVKEIQQQATNRQPELVVREDVEERYDLVDVCVDSPPRCGRVEIVLRRVLGDGGDYRIVGEEGFADGPFPGELEPIDSGARLMERA